MISETLKHSKIATFKGQKIRKTIYNNEWWFSVVDVVEALTDSNKPRVYWHAMKDRVKLESSDGKKYLTDCANTEGLFRIPAHEQDVIPAKAGIQRKV